MSAGARFTPSRPYQVREGEFEVDADPARVDLDAVHGFPSTCYWCPGIPREVVERSIAGSLCFGVYDVGTGGSGAGAGARAGGPPIGFARVITDAATFAYLADVFVREPYRARGVGKLLMRAIMGHPDVQGLRRWMLLTRDAHRLYEGFGFVVCAYPERVMEKRDTDVYRRGQADRS